MEVFTTRKAFLFLLVLGFLFGCKKKIEIKDLAGNWIGYELVTESHDTLIFQDDRKPYLSLKEDSTFYFKNRWGNEFEGSFILDEDYLLFYPDSLHEIVNRIAEFSKDSFLILEMKRDTVDMIIHFDVDN